MDATPKIRTIGEFLLPLVRPLTVSPPVARRPKRTAVHLLLFSLLRFANDSGRRRTKMTNNTRSIRRYNTRLTTAETGTTSVAQRPQQQTCSFFSRGSLDPFS